MGSVAAQRLSTRLDVGQNDPPGPPLGTMLGMTPEERRQAIEDMMAEKHPKHFAITDGNCAASASSR